MSARAILSLLALALLAAAPFDLFPVSREQVATNEEVWASLPPGERDELRRVWNRFLRLDETRRNALMRRAATLGRLRARMERRLGERPQDDEIARWLADLPQQMPDRLARHGIALDPARPVGEQMQRHTHARIEAFLDGLVGIGRLDPASRPRWDGAHDAGPLPWTEYARVALELRKREELYLAEGAAPAHAVAAPAPASPPSTASAEAAAPAPDAEGLQELPPLEVVDRLRQLRRIHGYLGRAGRVLPLTPDERRELAATPDEELLARLQQMKEPRVRQLLQERGADESYVERVLGAPFREQERILDRVLSGNEPRLSARPGGEAQAER